MSHTPRLTSGFVFKRYLNAIRPRGSVVPPVVGLQQYFAEVLPLVPETVEPPPSTERADFLARLTVAGSDGLEVGHAVFDPLNTSVVTANGVTGTFSTVAPNAVYNDIPFDGLFNTTPGGAFYGQMAFDDGVGNLTPLTITFSVPVAAFGAYFTDIGDFGGNLTATLNINGGGTVVYPLPTIGATTGWLTFWGFVDNSGVLYDSVVFESDDINEAIAIDDIVMATLAQIAP